MADNDSDEEKNLEPSEKKRQEFEEQGKIPRSHEIQGVAGLVVGFGVVLLLAPTMARELVGLAQICWQGTGAHATEPLQALHLGRLVLESLTRLLGPLMAAMWLGALVVGLAQSRLVIPKEALKLDWNRVNPLENAKQKFFSSQPVVELAKGILKIGVLGLVVWWGVQPQLPMLPALTYVEPAQLLTVMEDFVLLVLVRTVPIAIVIAIADYSYQAWRIHEQMKMSRQELKEEHKRSEGDPQLKSARRQRQLQISRSVAALKQVPRADVIITNPTHFAIALRYRPDEAPAPVVIARGVDHLALKMQAVARQNDVPRVENRLLARALYAQCREGQMIPDDLYGTVADILGVIYRRRGRPWGQRRE